MGSPVSLREFRALISTTRNENFTNAAAAAWAPPTADKIAVVAYNDEGLAQPGLPSEVLQTRRYAAVAPTPGLREGELAFSTYLAGAWANVDPHVEAELLEASWGGIASPVTSRSLLCAAGSTATNLAITGIESVAVAGQALLVGVKGDGAGCGEVKPIKTIGTDWAELYIACNAAPAENANCIISTTVYPNEDAAQKYIDTLGIGHATADQRQTIGGVLTAAFSGLDFASHPKIDFTVTPTDHRVVPANERDELTHSSASIGNDPAFNRGIGIIHLGDHGSTTRTTRKGSLGSVTPAISYEKDPGPHGVNGMAGFTKAPGVATAEATMLFDEDMPGLDDDFTAGTRKVFLAQFGSTAGKTVAIELPNCVISEKPTSTAVGNLAGIKVMLQASENYSATSNVLSAAIRAHMF